VNVQHIRAALRWSAGIASVAAFFATIYGLVKEEPFATDNIWLATVSLIAIVATWLVVETLVSCKDEIIKAIPEARTLVRATIEEYEEQAALRAELNSDLPQIVGGERLR
jgi:hypothetical protein